MPRAFSISAADIAAERARTGGDYDKFDFANVLKLDTVALRPMGPRDVHLRILAVSAEHNVDHAILADTVNIAEARGGKIYPGNSAMGEVLAVGDQVTKFKPGDIVITHCNGEPDKFGFPLRIWAYDQPESIGWYGEEAVVGAWQLIKAPLVAIAVFSIFGNWNDFFGPLLYLNTREKFTFTLALRALQTDVSYGGRYEYLMALSLLQILPMLILYFAAQRYFIEGLTLTGVRG